MPNHDLNNLGDEEFEHLVQALLKKIIGAGTITFGDGPDGGREATYEGKAPYPSAREQWEGKWIFQAKFHNVRQIGPDKARKELCKDLRTELQKITVKYKRECDNYILATNVSLSSVPNLGTHDKIAQNIVPEFHEKIPHIHVWGHDDLSRFLDEFPEIRQTYLHLITPGDLIAELMGRKDLKERGLAEAVQLYVRTSFERDQYAQLDQAGEIGEKPMPLRRVFIDLDVKPRSNKDVRAMAKTRDDIADSLLELAEKETVSATETLISGNIPRTVVIGGPGQGKSTLCQYIAQIHRAYLLKKICELRGNNRTVVPAVVRIPFRVILKDYAQWIVDSPEPHSLERFIVSLVEERAGREITSEQIQEIFKRNPTLLILDGLDEVTDRKLRTRMLELLLEFIARSEDVLKADLQIVATSRPTGYSDQFDPSHFLHLTLLPMESNRVLEYTERWIKTKGLESAKGSSLRSSINDCLEDPHFSPLMNTPLQVTIFILIILSGGTPPRQREELFNEYLEVIYKRERAKSKTIIQTEKRLLFGLHQYMGYLLHRRAAESSDTRSRMKEEEFNKEVFRYLQHEDPYSEEKKLREKADQMIKEAHERLVLLVELESGFFGFEQRSLQEFFAAGYMADMASDSDQRFKRFQAIALPSHWRNVALFLAGRIGRSFPGEAAQILEACREIDRHKPDYFTKRGAWLALDIAVDRSFGPNRILQRSAIEYALTLLDADLDRNKRRECASRLDLLPKEDLEDHVKFLLLRRLRKIHLPDGFNTLDVWCSLMKDSAPIEEVVNSAIERGDVASETLLEKARYYRLPPKYIKSKFAAVCANLPEDKIIDLFFRHFYHDPAYVAQIWREIGFSDTAAISLFNVAVQRPLAAYGEATPKISFSLPSDVIGQIKLAWEFVALWRKMQRHVLGKGVVTELRKASEDLRKFMIQILGQSSAIIELKATSLAFLSKIFLFSPEQKTFDQLYQDFLSSTDQKQVETAEEILYLLDAPPLEIPEMGYLEPKILHARSGLTTAEASFIVFDSLNVKQWMEIRTALPNGKKIDLPSVKRLKLIVRLGIARLPKEELCLGSELVTKGINMIAKMLQQKGPEEWRAWTTLSRLSFWKWSISSHRNGAALKRALTLLCENLERTIDCTPGRWEIGGFISRIVDTDGLEYNVIRLLGVLDRMPEGRLCDRTYRAPFFGPSNPSIIKSLLKIAMGSGDPAFRGFLKWFRLFIFNMAKLPPTHRVKIPRMQFDTNRVFPMLEEAEGILREGILLLLAYHDSTSFEDTRRLLEFSISDRKPIDRAWAELINRTVRDSDTQEAIDFLESILSSGAKYPKAVKYAALEKYEGAARTTTIDIRAQEQDLGLPFQDTAV